MVIDKAERLSALRLRLQITTNLCMGRRSKDFEGKVPSQQKRGSEDVGIRGVRIVLTELFPSIREHYVPSFL